MERKGFINEGKRLELYEWRSAEPRGILFIVHGMAEHMGRYDGFASYLAERGISVFGFDSRCHGYTDKDTLGYSEGDIWGLTVKDCIAVIKALKEEFGLPHIVMGHSYGSFVTQRLIETENEADAYILSGSCYMKGAVLKIGHAIAVRGMKKAPREGSRILYDMTFASYDKKFGRPAAWLSRDEEEVRKYNADEMCGFCCSNAFYESFFRGLTDIVKAENMKKADINKPVYIFSGDHDPVGKMGKGVKKLAEVYRKNGIKTDLKLYKDGRHEMLNEINKSEVYEDILGYINGFSGCSGSARENEKTGN